MTTFDPFGVSSPPGRTGPSPRPWWQRTLIALLSVMVVGALEQVGADAWLFGRHLLPPLFDLPDVLQGASSPGEASERVEPAEGGEPAMVDPLPADPTEVPAFTPPANSLAHTGRSFVSAQPGLLVVDVVGRNPNAIAIVEVRARSSSPVEVCRGCSTAPGSWQAIPAHIEFIVCTNCMPNERTLVRTLSPDAEVSVEMLDLSSGGWYGTDDAAHARVAMTEAGREYAIDFDDGGGGPIPGGGTFSPDAEHFDLFLRLRLEG